MSAWTFETLAAATGGRLVLPAKAPGEGASITRISTDTRTLQRGDAFLALRGPSFDGHRFLDAAIAAGASLVVVDEEAGGSLEVAQLVVPSTRAALADLGRARRGELCMEVVGITGSCGKTSTKELLRTLLAHAGQSAAASPASYNNDIGVPHTLLACPADANTLVLELGTNGPGEIAHLCGIARPTAAIVTNVGASHLAGLGSEDGVALEKASLPASLPEGGFCVLNADCPRTLAMAKSTRARVYTFSLLPRGATESEANLFGYGLEFKDGGSELTLAGRMLREPRRVRIPLLGQHQVQNTLAAFAAARVLGVTEDELCEALEHLAPVKGRGQRVEARGLSLVDESYNANPTSMRASLRMLAAEPGASRKVAVLGGMAELGAASEDLHVQLGREIAALGLDLIVLVGVETDPIERGLRAAGLGDCELVQFTDREAAGHGLAALLHARDLVLFKASRQVGLEVLVEGLCKPALEVAGR